MDKIVLGTKDVAKILGIGLGSTLDLFHREDFPSFKISNKWKVHRDKFNEWLLKQSE